MHVLRLLVPALLLAGCGGAPPGFDANTRARFDQLVDASLKKHEAPGMILGVWSGGKQYLRAAGKADLATGRPMSATPLFRIGSLTKTFVGTAVMQLVDEKKLSLDDAVATLLPDAGVPGGDKITVRHLLMMRSGLPSYSQSPEFGKDFSGSRQANFTPAQLLAYAWKLPVLFPPGTAFHYSNTNTILLGLLIEKLDGAPLARSLKRRIFDPLGLTHTSFPSDGTIPGDYIHGYGNAGADRDDWSQANPSWGWAAGAIISTIADVRTYIEALGEGRLLSRETQARRLTEWAASPGPYPTAKYGLGWATMGGFLGHNGSLPGYVNMAMYDPKTKSTIVLMLNFQGKHGDATREIMREAIQILFPGRSI
jgi:D-alanyl-D-alanine carboxypeptidase